MTKIKITGEKAILYVNYLSPTENKKNGRLTCFVETFESFQSS